MQGCFAVLTAVFWMGCRAAAAVPATTKTDTGEARRWRARAAQVTLTRDDWGIAHVHGKTDADAVFGMTYAQCEDDFNRVEMNYLTALGRMAEADGEHALWSDLRQRLFIDSEELKREYTSSPQWLQTLMSAWADAINFYLATHTKVHAKVLTHFEPWMALSFTEGSIGGDIERVGLQSLQRLYGAPAERTLKVSQLPAETEQEPRGSNGIAIAPQLTANGHALLLINPHTSFFFRSELQMTSDEGLNAYGAVTWGQFFVYQGWNEHAGWMHTSSNVDAVDEFTEIITQAGSGRTYRYGALEKPVTNRPVTLSYKQDGRILTRTFLTYATEHGPVVRQEGDRWVAVKLMQRHVPALEQSYLRTKSTNYADFRKTIALMGNSSNNTVYADCDGTIAYWHGNFIPRRDTTFDYTKPVDGSNPATDWHGLLTLNEIPQLKNPASGWLFNVNDSPWNGAGRSSLKQSDFPVYVEQGIESARGIHALELLTKGEKWTAQSLRKAAYDSYLPWFATTIPALSKEAKETRQQRPLEASLSEAVKVLEVWDQRWAADSEATTLAIYWGTELLKIAGPDAKAAGMPSEEWVATKMEAHTLLTALEQAVLRLKSTFGDWHVAWGRINRFQRLSGDVVPAFDDRVPSTAVPFVSSVWGSLASFGAKPYPGTKEWYGTSGNSFVAVVEFGPRVRAIAVTAGGESGHPESTHFTDEAGRYAGGMLREVYFYPDQLKRHTERIYRPGE